MTGPRDFSPWIILAILVASRVYVFTLGIAPDSEFILFHWQFTDLELLYSRPFETIWLLHAQPPLFNLLIAGLARIKRPDPQSIVSALLVVHIALTFVVANQIAAMLRCLGVAK